MKNFIAVFDSGMGGLTVLKEIDKLLPSEDIVYYADAANCPYGDKSEEEVRKFVASAIEKLIAKGAKVIVIACNTAVAVARAYLRSRYKTTPFVMIEPAVKPAMIASKSKVIGVLATRRTIEGAALSDLVSKWSEATGCSAILQHGSGLAEIVENNQEDAPETEVLIKKYLDPFIAGGADHVVLGCTHYPFIASKIEELLPSGGVAVVNPAPAVALRVKNILKQEDALTTETSKGIRLFESSAGDDYNTRLREKYNLFKEKV